MTTSGEPNRIAAALAGTRPWVRLVGVLGLLVGAFMLGIAALALAGLPFLGEDATTVDERGTAIFGLIYFLMASILYIAPSMYLLKYASRIRDYQRENSILHLELALEAQRAFWRIVGIVALCGLLLTLLGVVAILVPLLRR